MKNILILLTATVGLALAGFFGTVAVVKATSSPTRGFDAALDSAMGRQTKGLIGGSVGAVVGLVGSALLVSRLDRRNEP